MKLHFLALISLACSCLGGPLIPLIAVVVGETSAFFDGAFAAGFGIAASDVWFDGYVIYSGGLYYGSTAAGVGTFAAGVGGGAADVVAQRSKSLASKASVSSASVASVASVSSVSVASVKSVESVWTVSHSSRTSELSASESQARQSVLAQAAAAESLALATTRTYLNPFDFSTIVSHVSKTQSKRSVSSIPSTIATTGTVPPPPGTPVSTLPAGSRPSGAPPGVPDYVFDMCKHDLIVMGSNKQSLNFDQPRAQSIRVDNVPATCMTLSTVIMGNPDLGPHPFAAGSASLQWDNIHPDTIDLIRKGFGLPPMNETADASKPPP